MQKWFTVEEFSVALKIGTERVYKMVAEGLVKSVRITSKRNYRHPEIRILDPGEEHREWLSTLTNHRLECIPLLTYTEVAELLDLSPQTVKWHAHNEDLHCHRENGQNLYSIYDIRRFIWKRDKRRGKKDRVVHSNVILSWAKRILKDDAVDVVKDEMEKAFEDLLKLEEPERSMQVELFFRKVDALTGAAISDVRSLLAGRLGDHPSSEGSSARSASPPKE